MSEIISFLVGNSELFWLFSVRPGRAEGSRLGTPSAPACPDLDSLYRREPDGSGGSASRISVGRRAAVWTRCDHPAQASRQVVRKSGLAGP